MSDFKRGDEEKLKELTELSRCVGRQNIPEDEQLRMLYLEDRYNHFIEEGMQKLYTARNVVHKKSTDSMLKESPDKKSIQPPQPGPSDVPRTPGKLWTWINENVIVGGIPFAGQQKGEAGHLLGLRRECADRGVSIASVVSCLETEEAVPEGFAETKDWEEVLGVVSFFFLPFIPRLHHKNPPDVNNEMLDELLDVSNNVYSICCRGSTNGMRSTSAQKTPRAVYVQCKTGYTRSWVFAMAYLMSQHCMEYSECDGSLRQMRDFEPSSAEVNLAMRFSQYLNTPRNTESSSEEHAYHKLLADVLCLSQGYRMRLIRDLQNLT